jgi:glycosyltransferase involved in cell wall biosynthesis
MPKISICIPAYKQPEHLKRLLDSIFEQTFTDYEIVITDDTPDSSVSKIVGLYRSDRLKYFKNKTQLGIDNWNEGIRKSSGAYIKIMHHDDWFKTTESLGTFYDALVKSQSSFVFCQSENVNEKGVITKTNNPSQKYVETIMHNPLSIFLGNMIGAPSATLFIKSDLLFDGNIRWWVDVEFYIRYLTQFREIYYIKEPLVCIGIHSEQVTNECVNNEKVVYGEFLYSHKKLSETKLFSKKKLNELFCVFFTKNPVGSVKKMENITLMSLNLKQKLMLYYINGKFAENKFRSRTIRRVKKLVSKLW